MRICGVIASLGAGGAERVMTTLCGAWRARGDAVTLLTLDDGRDDFHSVPTGVERRALGLAARSHGVGDAIRANAARVVRLRRAIDAVRPDVVVSFTDRTNVLTLLATRGLAVRTVVSERTDPRMHDAGGSWRALRAVTYRHADALVVQTDAVRRWAEGLVSAERVHVIANPVRTNDRAQPMHSRARRIVGMGRFVAEKGFDRLIASFALAARSPLGDGWELVIHGDGPERPALEAQRDALAVRERIHLPGRTPDADGVLAAASVFVLSSRYEGFPNALLEGMAAACACVATDCPSGPASMIAHGVSGQLVPVDDVDAMSLALHDLMADEVLRTRLGNAAKAAVARYSLPAVLDAWDAAMRHPRAARSAA